MGDSTTVYDPRSGSCVRYCLSFADKGDGHRRGRDGAAIAVAVRRTLSALIGSIRRECLDHVIVLNERHLRAILLSYIDYYQRSRTHLGARQGYP